MFDRVLWLIHWLSLVSFVMGLYLFAVIMNACGACILKYFSTDVLPFWGVYLVFVIGLWIVKSRWIWFPWQLDKN